MKEITKLQRQSIFALYLNQPIAHHNDLIRIDGCSPLDIFGTHSEEYIEQYSLFVKPLSKITDEDAIYIAKIICGKHYDISHSDLDISANPHPYFKKTKTYYFRQRNKRNAFVRFLIYLDGSGFSHNDNKSTNNTLAAFDYLRSKGYALPYSEYTVDDLIAAGVFKINDNF